MFEHRRIARQLDAYVDGELPMPRLPGIESHLDECPDCHAHVKLLLAIRRSLTRVARPYSSA